MPPVRRCTPKRPVRAAGPVLRGPEDALGVLLAAPRRIDHGHLPAARRRPPWHHLPRGVGAGRRRRSVRRGRAAAARRRRRAPAGGAGHRRLRPGRSHVPEPGDTCCFGELRELLADAGIDLLDWFLVADGSPPRWPSSARRLALADAARRSAGLRRSPRPQPGHQLAAAHLSGAEPDGVDPQLLVEVVVVALEGPWARRAARRTRGARPGCRRSPCGTTAGREPPAALVDEHHAAIMAPWSRSCAIGGRRRRHRPRRRQALGALLSRYREPHRRYHGLAHVVRVLRTVDDLVRRRGGRRRRRGTLRGLVPRRRLRPARRRQRGGQRPPGDEVLAELGQPADRATRRPARGGHRGPRAHRRRRGGADRRGPGRAGRRPGHLRGLRPGCAASTATSTRRLARRAGRRPPGLPRSAGDLPHRADGRPARHGRAPTSPPSSPASAAGPGEVPRARRRGPRALPCPVAPRPTPSPKLCSSCGPRATRARSRSSGEVALQQLRHRPSLRPARGRPRLPLRGSVRSGGRGHRHRRDLPACGAKGVLVSAYGPDADPDEMDGIRMVAERYGEREPPGLANPGSRRTRRHSPSGARRRRTRRPTRTPPPRRRPRAAAPRRGGRRGTWPARTTRSSAAAPRRRRRRCGSGTRRRARPSVGRRPPCTPAYARRRFPSLVGPLGAKPKK